ncbi:Rossmann-like and DUF2520 domain-containing protein [Alkalibacter mobilis]|uniref:Rossmann-like and DUF2520 domain-containing protein n=1 Tax=Alkalibacter mobilis TaxID=2787712 RepID=UPI00189C6F5C|nr:Rossmann-like and DUF2520 domain-containing protein [Alkalibacter mobilis]MBF7097548.1 DUF2520 domain-containing protein [Alkalibacter mobilis]
MKIGFIGAGNVGVSMGRFFNNKGLQLTGYYSRSWTSSKYAAKQTDSLVFTNIEEIARVSNILFLTVPDNALAEIVDRLYKSGQITKKHLLVHLSGALDSGIFATFDDNGCGCYSFHPVMTFPHKEIPCHTIEKAWFTHEGNEKNLNDFENMISTTNLNAIKIKKEDKVLYHGGACVLSNYLVTLLYFGFKMLEFVGWEDDLSKRVFMPLIQATLENFEKKGSLALSGPIARGDGETIKKHIDSLATHDEQLLDFYTNLGRLTAQMNGKDFENILRGDLI